MELGKIDVAIAQLDQSIELYFCGGDEIAIHTLAMASHEVLTNVVNIQHQGRSLFQKIAEDVKNGRKEDFKKIFPRAYNYFKHAKTDTNETIEFNPEINSLVLLSAALMVKEYFPDNLSVRIQILILWMLTNDKDIFSFSEFDANKLSQIEESLHDVIILPKNEFFRECQKYL